LLFRRKRSGKVTGVSLVVVKKGYRILLVEIQSLLTDISSKNASINTTGLNKDQIIKIVRILKERLNINVSDQDITMSTTGEIEIDYPYIQLAIASSILSFVYMKDVSKIVFIGEIDLTGYIHSFYGLNKLLEEAKKVKDIKSIYCPPLVDMKDVNDSRINFVESIFDLQNKLFST
jgi:DNA repair protein RadA/Sms